LSEFLEKYLEAGLSQIVVIEYEHSESASGHTESTHETAIARKGKAFVKISVRDHFNFFESGPNDASLTEEKITAEEYRKLAKGKEIVDSQERLQRRKQDKERSRRSEKLYEAFHSTAPSCPNCDARMTLRSGPRGPFWGCPHFPKCRGTANFSRETKEFYKRWSEN
jgi:hypothetical protein